MSKKDFLIYKIGELGLAVTDRQAEQLEQFYEDLIEKNQVMNLTAITEWTDVVTKHYVDSLAIVKVCGPLKKSNRVIDVGTGAGFPGIPLAILFPEAEITMVDSVGKKIAFLTEEISRLKLTRTAAIHGRVEDLARQPQYREQFDCCVSRAVANLATLSEYCLPFVKQGGSFLAYKAGNCEEEVENAKYAIRQLSGRIRHMEYYQIQDEADEKLNPDQNSKNIAGKTQGERENPGEDVVVSSDRKPDSNCLSRVLIEIEKTGKTPAKYPRKAGTPSRTPLS